MSQFSGRGGRSYFLLSVNQLQESSANDVGLETGFAEITAQAEHPLHHVYAL